MKVYIYRTYISNNEDEIYDKAFDYLASKCDDIAYAENNVDDEIDNNVEIEQCTSDEIDDYIINGYEWLGGNKNE